MKIMSLNVKNFLSYGEEKQTITFNDGVNFIVGPNGSGKTNIVRAIRLAAECFVLNSIDIAKYDPDIMLRLHIKLSKEEQKLLGSILCISIFRELEELEQPGQINTFRELIFKDILNEIDDEEIKEIYEDNKKLLNLQSNTTDKSDRKRFDEMRNQIISNLQIHNLQSFKEYMEKKNPGLNLGLLRGDCIEQFKDILLLEETHIIVGELFEKFYIRINADATRLSSSLFFSLNKRELQLDHDGLRNQKSQNQSIPFIRSLHNFLRLKDVEIKNNIINTTIEFNFKSEKPFRISFPRFDRNYGNEEVKNLCYNIVGKLKAYYYNQFPEAHINFINIVKRIFNFNTIVVPEHRGLIPETDIGVNIFNLTKLPETLYKWKNSVNTTERENYYKLKKEFKKLFKMDFDVYVEDETIQLNDRYPTLNIGDVVRSSEYRTSSMNDTKKVVSWDYISRNIIERATAIQFITENNIPLEINKAPSGAYETLMILTALHERGDKTIIIDEPARALHPQLQKEVVRSMEEESEEDNKPIFILITHSPYFISDYIYRNIWKCRKGSIINCNFLETSDQEIEPKDVHENKETKFLLRIDSISKMLFANRVIFVEGLMDKLFLEELDRKYPNEFNIQKNNWEIIDMRSSNQFPIVWNIIKKLELEYTGILDLDTAFEIQNRKKEETEQKFPQFENSIIGKMRNKFSIGSELENFAKKTLIDIRQNREILDNFYNLMLKEKILVWKCGRLEDVIGNLSSDKLKHDSTNHSDIFNCIENLSDSVDDYPILIELKNLFKIQS